MCRLIYSLIVCWLLCLADFGSSLRCDLSCDSLFSSIRSANHRSAHHRHDQQKEQQIESNELLNHERMFEKRGCFCDKHCVMYRDCCDDFFRSSRTPDSFKQWVEPQLAHLKHYKRLADCNLYIYDKSADEFGFKVNAAFSIDKCAHKFNRSRDSSPHHQHHHHHSHTTTSSHHAEHGNQHNNNEEQQGENVEERQRRETIDKCVNLPIRSDEKFDDIGKLSKRLEQVDYLQLLPVTIKQRGGESQPITYRNIYCAVCNDLKLSLADIKDIEFWQLGASCVDVDALESAQSQSRSNCIITYRKESTTTATSSQQPATTDDDIDDDSRAKLMSSMNNNGIRKCKQSIGKCTEDDYEMEINENDESTVEEYNLSHKCSRSQGFVYENDLRYKNSICALCNNLESQKINCTPFNMASNLAEFLRKNSSQIDLRYENNRVLYNRSNYETLVSVNYEYEARMITFKVYNQQQQQQQPEEADKEENKGAARDEALSYALGDESDAKRPILKPHKLDAFNILIWSPTYSSSSSLKCRYGALRSISLFTVISFIISFY